MKRINSPILLTFVRYLPLAIIALAWELAPRIGLVSPDLLPAFSTIIADGFALFGDPEIYGHAGASLYRAFSGLGVAIVFGIAAGVMMAWFKPVRVVLNPIVQMFYPMPKSALIPVMIIWLGIGSASKIVLIFLGCMLPVVISAYNGARGVDHIYIWSARSLGASRREVLWDIILPAAMPQILNGVRTALAICFVLLVSSELLISTEGLGFLIGVLGENGVYPTMFFVIFIVIAMGFFADRVYLFFSKRALSWLD
jgi:NitT/TauT family transport system permease protein